MRHPHGVEAVRSFALSDMLAPLIERGESALVSSFTGALDLAAEKLQADGIDTLLLTGETPCRNA